MSHASVSMDQPVASPLAVRLLLLSPSGAASPATLLARLNRRGATCVQLTEPAALMLELAIKPAGAIIMRDPGRIRRIDELRQALDRYYPHVPLWRYDDANGPGRLQRLESESGRRQQRAVSGFGTEVALPVARKSPPPPVAPRAPDAVRAESELEIDEPLLSAEELRMLLGTDEKSGVR